MSIKDVDPRTDPDRYARDYNNGWRASENLTDGALDRADHRGVSHAWYDGYSDSAVGRPKWTWRAWRLSGHTNSGCWYGCRGGADCAEGLPVRTA